MSIRATIEEQAKEALKAGKKARLEGLRYLLAQIKNLEIEVQREPSEEEVTGLLKQEAKRRQEAIEAYRRGGRQDLVDKEEGQFKVIQEFLPRQMSDEELEQVVEEVVSGAREKEFGPLMGRVMARVKGKADGKRVALVLGEVLGGERN